MKKRVVIIGMGDTGVLVAAHLKRHYEVTGISTKLALVSGQEVGARLTNLKQWKENYLVDFERFEQLESVQIIHGRAVKIEAGENNVHLITAEGNEEKLSYDVLVIASGTRNGFWRTEKVQDQDGVFSDLEQHVEKLSQASNIAIVGAGPTGVSVASNTQEIFPDKDVQLFFRGDKILSGYPPKTRDFVNARLVSQGVTLCPGHEVNLPNERPLSVLEPGQVTFNSGQNPVDVDCIFWANGNTLPNSTFIPKGLLNDQGFVVVNEHLQTNEQPNIFAVGDIAATDPNRSSARNAGFQTVAKNIDLFLSGHENKMKRFKASKYRWGSILGIQSEGMRIFTPKGGAVKITPWAVKNILFPVFVRRLIYRGIKPYK